MRKSVNNEKEETTYDDYGLDLVWNNINRVMQEEQEDLKILEENFESIQDQSRYIKALDNFYDEFRVKCLHYIQEDKLTELHEELNLSRHMKEHLKKQADDITFKDENIKMKYLTNHFVEYLNTMDKIVQILEDKNTFAEEMDRIIESDSFIVSKILSYILQFNEIDKQELSQKFNFSKVEIEDILNKLEGRNCIRNVDISDEKSMYILTTLGRNYINKNLSKVENEAKKNIQENKLCSGKLNFSNSQKKNIKCLRILGTVFLVDKDGKSSYVLMEESQKKYKELIIGDESKMRLPIYKAEENLYA